MTDPIVLGDGDCWEIKRGDTNPLELAWVQPDDAETPIDLTAVIHALRVHVKCAPDDPSAAAVLKAGSYFDDEYSITGVSNNVARMVIRPYRTRDLSDGTYKVDAELTRAGALITNVGTVDLVAGSGVIVGTGVDFSAVRKGDLLVPAGAAPGNDTPAVVVDVDAASDTVTTDYDGFAAEPAVSFALHVGQVDTGFSRDAVISDDRTR